MEQLSNKLVTSKNLQRKELPFAQLEIK